MTSIPPGWSYDQAREIMYEFVPPPEYRKVTANPPEPAKPLRWERPLFHCRVTWPLGTFHLLNAHFKSKGLTDIAGQGVQNFMWNSAAGWAEGLFSSPR